MKNKKGFKKDSQFEGRDQAYVDIDRMVNEGLSGGTVDIIDQETNIEEAHEFYQENPPYQTKS
ncbi:hypothetical protein [Niallia endozanthoxylica]|uniref:Uncharacterized protein n=1 Tax=Niallia endozanthoxylica TaxID=2036016 RepID=A0A5J5I5Z5_9BACI|nr:hypothetical protein [Niallia endozanthoxylica]KAA9031635.1 hypothetical protein F4V44_00895 [Niallia endozanthoxylica]